MKTKLHVLFFLCFLMGVGFSTAQEIVQEKPQNPFYIGTPTKVEYVPSIASRSNLVEADLNKPKEMQDGRSVKPSKREIVPGKGSQGDDALAIVQKNAQQIPSRMPSLVFETMASSSQPTDPAGAVGPDHYFAVINTAFRIFDKSGNPLTATLTPNPTIFPSGGCCDLTASYDNVADRWVITFLGGGAQIAVSTGPDPVNDGWTVYTYGSVVDYQKLSVWHDGYYMTDNTSGTFHVFERDEMLAGNAGAQMVSFTVPGWQDPGGFDSPQFLNLSHNAAMTGPATMVYFADDSWASVTQDDHIKLWSVTMDWANTGNSTISQPTRLGVDGSGTADGTVTAFNSTFDGGSFVNLDQPNGGTSIDALQWTVMNQAQVRKFGSHNSALFNFVVDVDGSATEQAGVRWYELRQTGDGQPWTIYQEGTYTAPDNRHAWNASLIMDVQGNIGMGYTSMSSANSADPNVRVGSYYTGQMIASSGSGTMDVAEEVIMAGTGNIPGTRYGDYSKIDIDPDGDKKFWFVNELFEGSRKNVCGVFQIAPNTNNDVGIISVDTPTSGALTNAETVTVTVYNYGENDASGFDVTYQVDGGTLVTEAFVGTLASQTSAQHVFSTTADMSTEGQTYTIDACTDLAGDEDINNDCISTDVTHILANDIGVTEITAPTSGEGLGMESITVTIENFGTASQSNFDVSYTIDAGTPVVEQVAGPLAGGATTSYTFTQQGDFSAVGSYDISATTQLGTDSDNSNDAAMITIDNISCNTLTNDTDMSVGPNNGDVTTSVINFANDFVINDVNVSVDIQHTWVGDLDITLTAPDGTTTVELMPSGTCGNCDDMNVTFDDDAANPITGAAAPISGDFQPASGSLSTFNGLQSAGDWTLTITDNANQDGGNLLSWSLQLCSNTNLSLDDVSLDSDLQVIHQGDNQFLVKLPTSALNDRLELSVYNVVGQRIYWRTLENENGTGYEHTIDMSYVSSGVYFVRIGNNTAGNTKRIIVE